MQIPLNIGKRSNSNNMTIDLATTPLLMISYCEKNQLKNLFSQLQSITYPFKQKDYYIASIENCKKWEIDINNHYTLLKDEPEKGSIKNRLSMMKLLNDEISKREKILHKKKISDFKRYFSLNTWQTEKLSYQFFIVDDIWDMIVAKPKSIGLSIIRIILYGPNVGIHTIFTSRLSYQNLLEQLININPRITKELQKKFGVPEPNRITTFANELILTAENLVFHKLAGTKNMERMYLIR